MSHHPKYFEDCDQLLTDYDVTHLVHFTPLRNLESIYLEGLLPATNGEGDDAVCLSLLKPYMKMFHSKRNAFRQHEYFVFLIVSTDVIFDKLCGFFPESAISKNMIWSGKSAKNRTKSWDLEKVFCEEGNSYGFKASAEIQVLETVEPKYIQGIVPERGTPAHIINRLTSRFPRWPVHEWPEEWNKIR